MTNKSKWPNNLSLSLDSLDGCWVTQSADIDGSCIPALTGLNKMKNEAMHTRTQIASNIAYWHDNGII